jgi:hypothetical protein
MKKLGIQLMVAIMLLTVSTTQAQDRQETYKVSDFIKVYSNVPVRMYIEQGSKEALSIEADDDMFEDLEVYVEDEVLFIVSAREKYIKDEKLTVDMVVKDLNHIEIVGGAKIKFTTALETDEFRLDISGAADIDIELKCNKFMADLSGAANMNVWGKAKYAAWDISGASNIDAVRFITQATYLDFSGAGKAEVYAAKILKAEVSGIGLVKYDGNPSQITKDVSGLGVIKRY